MVTATLIGSTSYKGTAVPGPVRGRVVRGARGRRFERHLTSAVFFFFWVLSRCSLATKWGSVKLETKGIGVTFHSLTIAPKNEKSSSPKKISKSYSFIS